MKNRILFYFGVLFVVTLSSGKAYSCCQPPFAEFSVHPYTTVCAGDVLTFDSGHSCDPDGTTCTYTWNFGDGESGSGKIVTHRYYTCGDKTVTLTVTDNDDPDCCGGQPGCSDKSDTFSITVTVVRIDITDCTRGYVVLYCSGGGITADYTSQGCPSGGTYQWEAIYQGAGRVSLQNASSATVTVHPVAASSIQYDVRLRVTYSYSSVACHWNADMSVRVPTSTTSYAGTLVEQGSGPLRRYRRYWYHGVKDQFGEVIWEEGIPCDETVEWVEGKKGWVKSSPGSTGLWSRDGDFSGGMALRDQLGCLATWGYSRYSQALTAGRCNTSPGYDIFIDPIGDDRRIWKE